MLNSIEFSSSFAACIMIFIRLFIFIWFSPGIFSVVSSANITQFERSGSVHYLLIIMLDNFTNTMT